MIEQFQNVLQSPKPSSDKYLKMIQDAMLNTMEELMPQDFDFGQLAKMFDKETDFENLASFTYKLTQFFIKAVAENFISLQSYFALEHQTQKLQSTVRSHIKMEQEMKMYLEHLEYKIQRYEYHFKKIRKNNHHNQDSSRQLKQFNEKDSFEQLKKRETQLLKERLVLLRKVDHLERKLKDQENQLLRLNSPTSATIQQIKESFNREIQASVLKLPDSIGIDNQIQSYKTQNEIDRRMSTNSFGSDYQITQKKSSNSMNVAQTYRLYSQTGREMAQPHNFPSIEMMETIKQIPVVQSQNIILLQNNKSPIQYLVQIQ